MEPRKRQLSVPVLLGLAVFVVVAVLIAVFLDAPTSVWLLVGLSVLLLALGGVLSRSSRTRT